MELSEQENKIYDKALKLLSVRIHASRELAVKLSKKGFVSGQIQNVILVLTEQGLLNDELTADSYLDSLANYKTFGFYGIKAKMLNKGFEPALVERLLNEKFGADKELELARKFLKKKPRTKMSAAQSLARKGFRSQVIAKVLPDLSEEV
ncbi:MAG: regulatory protein RecX [Acidobacteriaceae bacterium]